MIRGRKEGSNYATWFIGFDHDDAFGLAPFQELPPSRPSSTAPNRPHLNASSLESLTPTSPTRRGKSPLRSTTPIGTQTPAPPRPGQPISTQTSATEYGDASAQTADAAEQKPRTSSTGTETLGLDPGEARTSKSVETATQQTSVEADLEARNLGFAAPKENGELQHCNGRSRTVSSSSSGHAPPVVTSLVPDAQPPLPPLQREKVTSVTDTGTGPGGENTISEDDVLDGAKRSRTRTNSSGSGAKPSSEDFESRRNRRRKDRETQGLYREAFDGAKRAEEFKFRVRFDQILGELHVALDEKSPQGLPASFASPIYGEVMLTFRDKVKDLLKGFTQRLQLAHESFGSLEPPEDTAQRVKQDVSRFIEDLIGETLDLTSDEAVSDLSSLSDDSNPDTHPTFEDLLAQALVTKLLENHRKAVRDSLEQHNDNDPASLRNNYNNSNDNDNRQQFRSFDNSNTDSHIDQLFGFHQQPEYSYDNLNNSGNSNNYYNNNNNLGVRNFLSVDQPTADPRGLARNRTNYWGSTGDLRGGEAGGGGGGGYRGYGSSPHPRDVFGGNRQISVSSLHASPSSLANAGLYSKTLSNQNSLSVSADALVPEQKFSSEEEDAEEESEFERRRAGVEEGSLKASESRSRSSSGKEVNSQRDLAGGVAEITQGESLQDQRAQSPADPEKEFAELRDFVRRTQQQARSKVEARDIHESFEVVEVQEEELCQTSVNRDEERHNFHDRYSVLDRVHTSEPALPDFSQFENIDFTSSEIDPDLLAMNLAIIPEETEEELEQEEEDEEEEDGEGEEGRGKWRNNWIFKGKGVSVYDNLGTKKKMNRLDQDGPLIMMVPRPEDDFVPKVGNRDVDQLSDFSEGDLLSRSDLDNTDDDADDENSFYANTSKELARIASRRLRSNSRGDRQSDRSSYGLETEDGHLELAPVEDIPGPIVQPVKPEIKLLYDLIPAEGDDPRFVSPPESLTIQEGEPVQFSCRVAGTQPFDVFWYREGDEVEELEEGEDVEIGNSGDKYWLNLYNVGHKEAGQYMCIALSEQGKAIQYIVISVKDNKQELKKPEFLKGLKDVEVTEGQSVKFRVKVKGYPQPRVNWFKDGNLLRHSRSCRIEKFGNRDYILTIDYATMDDDAEYTVSARNVAGTEKLSAQVIVEPRSELPPRRQRMSSVTTSAASDSDSDFPGPRRLSSSYNVASSRLPPSQTSSSPLLLSARRAGSPSSLLSQPPQHTSTPASSSLSSSTKPQQHQDDSLPQEMSQKSDQTSGEVLSQTDFERLLPSLSAAPSFSPRTAMQARENEVNLNHLDRKVTLTQKRVEEEADKMKEDAKKYSASSAAQRSNRDIMSVAEETLRMEAAVADTPDASTSKGPESDKMAAEPVLDLDLPDELDDFPLPGLPAKTKAPPVKSTFALSLSGKDGAGQKDLGRDDFEDWAKPIAEKEKFKSEVSFPQNNNSNVVINKNSQSNTGMLLASPLSQNPAVAAATTNINNISFDSGRGGSVAGGDNATASLASSVSSSTSSLGGGATGDLDDGPGSPGSRRNKGRFSRDFEVTQNQTQQQQQHQQKKKWSVTLDPFSPQAEVVNKQQEEKHKTETQVSSPSLSAPQLQQQLPPQATSTTTTTANTPRRRISREERPPPVHMVGTSSEADLPESRTEFNTDGSVQLPSVNRLKALFGGGGSPNDGGSNFKRASPAPHAEVHSITARSVSRDKLERLRSPSDQMSPMATSAVSTPSPRPQVARAFSPPAQAPPPPPSSSTSTSAMPPSSPSSSTSPSASRKLSSSATLQLNTPTSAALSSTPSSPPSSSSSSGVPKVTLRPISASESQHPEKSRTASSSSSSPQRRRRSSQMEEGAYVEVDDGKDPVLIYPERDPEYWKRQRMLEQQQQQGADSETSKGGAKSGRASSPLHQSSPLSLPSPSSSSNTTATGTPPQSSSPSRTPRSSQPRLVVRRANPDNVDLDALEKSGGTSPVNMGRVSPGGTRIKAGCISARAAFWEKKMGEGGEELAEEDFPELVEESDN